MVMKKCVISLLNGYGLRDYLEIRFKVKCYFSFAQAFGRENVLKCENLEQPGYEHCNLHPSCQDTLFHIKNLILHSQKLLHQHFATTIDIDSFLVGFDIKTDSL